MDAIALIDESWLNSSPSPAEERFAVEWVCRYPEIDLHTEERLIPGRRYRFDFVHYPSKVAIEIQGFKDHNSVKGVKRDQEKLILAAVHGFQVLQVPSSKCDDPEWLGWVADVIRLRGML